MSNGFRKGYPVIYMKDGEWVEFQANKDYGYKDIVESEFDGKRNKRIKITMTIGDANCYLKDTDTKEYRKASPGDKAKIYIPDKLTEILLNDNKIMKGERYRIERLDKFTLGIKNITRGEAEYTTHNTEKPVQKHIDINKPEPEEDVEELPVTDTEAVKASIKGFKKGKDYLLMCRAISERVESRILKALSFAKVYVKDETAQAIIARLICDSFDSINTRLLKNGKQTVDYVSNLELEELEEEDNQIKQNAKEELK